MRHAGGHIRILGLWVILCAMAACSAALRPSAESQSAPGAPPCALSEPPSHQGDTATIVFRVPERDTPWGGHGDCALQLVAMALRPWPTPSDDPWAVEVILTQGGATAHRLSGERARDALDAGLALIATEDLDLVAYGAGRPDLGVTPLPWDRTYLWLAPGLVSALGGELPTDAVRVDARHAAGLSCDTVLKPITSGRAASARVVYQTGDRTGRELAERVVAIRGDTTTTAVALGPAGLDAALRAGNELAYIVSVPSSGDVGCDGLAALARRAPWLGPHSILPLVDTRAYVIAPRAPRP
jgi:hypothetical protein